MRIRVLLLIGFFVVAPATAVTQQQRTSTRADLQGCWYGGSLDGRTISRSPRDSAFTAIPIMVELGPRSRVPADSSTGRIVRHGRLAPLLRCTSLPASIASDSSGRKGSGPLSTCYATRQIRSSALRASANHKAMGRTISYRCCADAAHAARQPNERCCSRTH
jgi:hypothetical protein